MAGQKNGKGLVKTVYSRGISSCCTFYFQESENCQKLYNFVMKQLQTNEQDNDGTIFFGRTEEWKWTLVVWKRTIVEVLVVVVLFTSRKVK